MTLGLFMQSSSDVGAVYAIVLLICSAATDNDIDTPVLAGSVHPHMDNGLVPWFSSNTRHLPTPEQRPL